MPDMNRRGFLAACTFAAAAPTEIMRAPLQVPAWAVQALAHGRLLVRYTNIRSGVVLRFVVDYPAGTCTELEAVLNAEALG